MKKAEKFGYGIGSIWGIIQLVMWGIILLLIPMWIIKLLWGVVF